MTRYLQMHSVGSRNLRLKFRTTDLRLLQELLEECHRVFRLARLNFSAPDIAGEREVTLDLLPDNGMAAVYDPAPCSLLGELTEVRELIAAGRVADADLMLEARIKKLTAVIGSEGPDND